MGPVTTSSPRCAPPTIRSFGGCGLFGCFPASPSPDHYSHANPLQLSVRRRGERLTLEFQWAQAAAGFASGRSADDDFLSVDYGGSVFGVLGSFERGLVRVGAGPALHRGSWKWHQVNVGDDNRRSSSVGAVGSAGLAIPVGRWVLIEGSGQLRRFRKVNVDSPRVGAQPVRPFEADVSHWYLGAGVGLRFQ